MKKNRRLYVDADACPVKDEITRVITDFNVSVIFVASYAHMTNTRNENWVFVDSVKEEVDLYIVNHVQKGDLAVTQDMGLASLLTAKHVYVMSPYGKQLTEEDMPQVLHHRYLSYKQLNAGKKVKGPKAFTQADRQQFSEQLERLLRQVDEQAQDD